MSLGASLVPNRHAVVCGVWRRDYLDADHILPTILTSPEMDVSPFFRQSATVPQFDDFDNWLERAEDSDPLPSLIGAKAQVGMRDVQLQDTTNKAAKHEMLFTGKTERPQTSDSSVNRQLPFGEKVAQLRRIDSDASLSPTSATPSPLPRLQKSVSSGNSDIPESSSQSPAVLARDLLITQTNGGPNRNEYVSHEVGPSPNIELVPTSILPDRLRCLFPFQFFNAMQSKSFEAIYYSDHNVVLSAPTGSGKTACFEIAIARLMKCFDFSVGTFKIIYMGPTKSLCQERVKGWNMKFSGFSMRCGELTGDTDGGDGTVLRDNDMIVTTPEKWDAVTRKSKDFSRFTDLIRLVLIDEVHLLNESRGAVLEVVIARMKLRSKVRFVAVSATFPNIKDVGQWIGQPWSEGIPATTMCFGEEFRPVKLDRYCYGLPQSSNQNDFRFDSSLDKMYTSHGSRPTLVFCSTRNAAQNAAQSIVKQYDALQKANAPLPWLQYNQSLGRFSNSMLREMSDKRIGYHHAGLDAKDRSLIENLFLQGKILVLCCTTTLAMGVNVPAHLVIVKNTQTYYQGEMRELGSSEILQMIGRAGRPQFHETGVAVILTRVDKRVKYENLVAGNQPLESQLHLQLVEHINAEISLGTIFDICSATTWLRNTFFYVRCRANPKYYGMTLDRDGVDSMIGEKCTTSIETLVKHGLVETTQGRLKATAYGEAAARYYLRLPTVYAILEMTAHGSVKDMVKPFLGIADQKLDTLCKADEYQGLRLRIGERGFYNDVVNQNYAIRFPFKFTAKGSRPVEETWQKVSLLLQIELGLADFAEAKEPKYQAQFTSMTLDKAVAIQTALRIAKFMRECVLQQKNAQSLINIMTLERCLHARCWNDAGTMLKQIRNLGVSSVRLLAMRGIKTFEQLRSLEPEALELWFNRSTPFGRDVLNDLARIPRYDMQIVMDSKAAVKSQALLQVTCCARVSLLNDRMSCGGKGDKKTLWTTFVATMNGVVHCYQIFPNSSIGARKDIKFVVDMIQPNQVVHCYVGCENIVGCEIDTVFDPAVDEGQFASLIGPNVQSIVRRQPTISELVCGSLNSLVSANQTEPAGGMTIDVMDYNTAARDLDFQHLQSASGTAPNIPHGDAREPARIAAQNTEKRKANFEDAFTDFEFDNESEFDETELKKLEQLEPPQRLANGNYRCGHHCKDKTKCKHLCCKEGKASSKTEKRPTRSKPRKSTITPVARALRGTQDARTVDRTPLPKRQRMSDASAEIVKFTGGVEKWIESEAPSKDTVKKTSQRRASWMANKDIRFDSDADLPPLQHFLAKATRKGLSASQPSSKSNQPSVGNFAFVQREKDLNSLNIGSDLESKAEEYGILGDYFTFSANDVMEIVEIVP